MLRRLRRRWLRLLVTRRRKRAAVYGQGPDYRRSRALLRRCLSQAQRREFDRRYAFTVRAASGRVYRIRHAASINVEVLSPSGTVAHRLCAAPYGLPVPAVMLSQKLMLEADEPGFLAIAIQHPANAPGFWPGSPPQPF